MGLCVLPFGPQPPWAMPHISAGYLKVPSSKKAIPQQLKNHKSGPTVHCKMGKWRRERTAQDHQQSGRELGNNTINNNSKHTHRCRHR